MAGPSHGRGLQDSESCSELPAPWLCGAPPCPVPGMWRWSLHKKVDRDPGKSPALVRILLRELEKVGSQGRGHCWAIRVTSATRVFLPFL